MRKLPSLKRYLYELNLDMDVIGERISGEHHGQLSRLEQMVIVQEDRRYLRHGGVDWASIARVVLLSLVGRRVGGASTIEMQLVRTILNRRAPTISRKLGEMIRAHILNYRYEKLTILRTYLGLAYFGSDLIGAESACKTMYDKPVDQLSVSEASIVAAMLVYPRPSSPNHEWHEKIRRRSSYGLRLHARLEKTIKKVERS